MNRLFSALALAATAALLWPSATPARACSCVYSSTPEFVDFADLIVIGRLYVPETTSAPTRLSIETYLKGSGPAETSLGDFGPGDCRYGFDFADGSRHLLLLQVEGSRLSTNSCSGSVVLDTNGGSDFAEQRLREVIAITGEGTPPTSGRASEQAAEIPVLPLAVAAVAIPLVFVLAASFVFPAKGART